MTVVSSSASGAPISFSGLGSGLNTSEIITALMGAERAPITRLSGEQTTIEGREKELQSLESSLTQLTFDAQELGSPVLFNTSQGVVSSEPTRVAATSTTGAAVGGYEVEVTQLANSAQRTFTFKSPAAVDKLTIDGKEIEVSAGAKIGDLVAKINSDPNATVYAAAVGEETVVLSTRATGATGAGYIAVSDPGGTLVEKAGLAKEGRNAEYKIDGVAGTSTSNKLAGAIPGVTLELKGLTTTSGPVTVEVQPPGPNTSAIVAQVQAFVTLYNSTVAALNTQVHTKPPETPHTAAELQTGTLFGDFELTSLLGGMRQSVYAPGTGLPASMASLADVGINTGAPVKGAPSQSSLEGQLTVNTAQLESALASNPTGVEKVLQSFSKSFLKIVNASAGPGGTLGARATDDGEQVSQLVSRIAAMNEMLAVRQQTLQAEFAAMEKVLSQNQAESSWLNSQMASLLASQASSGSSSSSSSGH
jgi:flagellar hook-associated protein 2